MDVDELSINTDGIVLPGKIARRNEAGIKNEKVCINGSHVAVDGFPKEFFGYRFEVKGSFFRAGAETEPKDLSQGPRADVSMHARHKFLFKVFRFILKSNKDHFNKTEGLGGNVSHDYLYDSGNTIYSKYKIPDKAWEFDEAQITEAKLLDSDDLKAFIGRVKRMFITFTYTHAVNTEEAFAKQEPEILRILNILSEQNTRARNNTHIYNNKMFYMQPKENHDKEMDAIVIKLGAQKAFCYSTSEGKIVPFLHYYPKSAMFYPEKLVTEFMATLFNQSPSRMRLSDNDFAFLNKHLKGVSVVTTHLPRNRMFAIHKLTDRPANRLTFKKDDRDVVVADYFYDCYKTRLAYPDFPCAVHRRPNSSDCFYPLEYLRILPGQHLSLEKQTQCKLTEKLLHASLKNPTEFVKDVEMARTDATVTGNPYFKHYGTIVLDQVTERPASVLCPPAIAYGNYTHTPNDQGLFGNAQNVEWRMGRNMFLKPAQVPKWAVVIIGRSVQQRLAEDFANILIRSGSEHGMIFPRDKPEVLVCDAYELAQMRETFLTMSNHKCRFALFLSKGNDAHGLIKFVENETQIVTQHIGNYPMVDRLTKNPRGVALDNLLMKMNLKLGGVNYTIRPADILARKRMNVHNILSDQSMKGRMFIGLDLSHSGPQSVFERTTGAAVQQPTVVGMSFTLDSPANMRGSFWMQGARQVIIQSLSGEICNAIHQNTQANGNRSPSHIIVYRNGVSEGEYKKVVAVEKKAIDDAIDKLKKDGVVRNAIKVTIVVVQRISNYRMVPARFASKNEKGANSKFVNVQAGTIIDGDLMNPAYTEFLLNSHTGIQGTSRPVRYTVVCDTANRMDLVELENVTNAMCYLHGIVTSPVSVPAPLYSAEDLAKRGRNNWKTLSDDLRRCGDGSALGKYVQQPSATIDSRFWA